MLEKTLLKEGNWTINHIKRNGEEKRRKAENG